MEIKGVGGFVQSRCVSALAFIPPVALLRMDSRETKVEAGEHLENYPHDVGEKLPPCGSDQRW